MFFILDSSYKIFENCTVKLSAKETKWTSLEVRTHPTFLENLISKYDFGPVKLPGLSRNGPLAPVVQRLDNAIHWLNHYPADSMVCFVNTYPLDIDLSRGQSYPAFEQLGPTGL